MKRDQITATVCEGRTIFRHSRYVSDVKHSDSVWRYPDGATYFLLEQLQKKWIDMRLGFILRYVCSEPMKN